MADDYNITNHHYQPTVYSDQRTIYNQPTNPTPDSSLYEPPTRPTNRPRPAAPAAEVPAETPPAPSVQLPTRTNVWNRQHKQALTNRATAPAVSSLGVARRASAPDVDVGNIVYQSLQRPKLLRGGEWQLSMATNLIAAGFLILAIMGWNWRFLPGALFFGGPIQWLLRVMADYDPKRWMKYTRTIGQPLIRRAHGHPDKDAPPPRILPKPSWMMK